MVVHFPVNFSKASSRKLGREVATIAPSLFRGIKEINLSILACYVVRRVRGQPRMDQRCPKH